MLVKLLHFQGPIEPSLGIGDMFNSYINQDQVGKDWQEFAFTSSILNELSEGTILTPKDIMQYFWGFMYKFPINSYRKLYPLETLSPFNCSKDGTAKDIGLEPFCKIHENIDCCLMEKEIQENCLKALSMAKYTLRLVTEKGSQKVR